MSTITLVGVFLCDKRILLERELPYTLKSANKQLTRAFLHLVANLQRRFYTLALISVLYVNIYSPSLRLFKTDPLLSLLSATHGQCLILVLCLPLSWLCVTFVLNTLIALKELFFQSRSQSIPVRGLMVGIALAKRTFPGTISYG